MPTRDTTRRTLLRAAAVASAGGLAGCSLLDGSPPPGTLVASNDHDRTHRVSVTVVGRPESTASVDDGREWTDQLEAGEEVTTEQWLSGPTTYRLEIRVDEREPELMDFEPVQPGDNPSGNVLRVRVDGQGELAVTVDPVETVG